MQRVTRGFGSKILVAAVIGLGTFFASAASGVQASEPLRAGKGFPSLFQFTPLDVGVETGIFKKHGVDVEISAFAGDAKLHQAFTAGAIDIGIGSGPGLAFIAKGAPVLGIAQEAGPPLGITMSVLASGPIQSVADLKGKLVSISSVGSQTEWMVRELSRQQGWGPDGIRLATLGDATAQLSALRTHQIDAAPFDITTAYQLKATGDVRILMLFGDIVKDYVNHVIYAENDVIAKRPDDLRKFLAGWFETIAFVKSHKEETVKISSAVLKIPAPVVSQVYDETMPMLSDDGRFNAKGLAVLSRSFVDMKMLPTEPDMTKLYTEKFLPGAAK
jgi:ABC-type nitrate/sulfonate/bicarbonate transport system substrate-binding protein